MMEALFVLALFLALAILSLRYGVDSRESPRSKEHDLAVHGVTWNDSASQPRAADTPAPAYPSARGTSTPVAAPAQSIALTSGR